jgi:hypothetical protein
MENFSQNPLSYVDSDIVSEFKMDFDFKKKIYEVGQD